MVTINEDFINRIFDAMVEIRPKLAKYNDPDESDFDTRELANKITQYYPWPIGNEIRKLLSANMQKLDRGRLDQILKTVEKTMQFLTFIMLVQLFDESLKGQVDIPDSFKKEFPRRFTSLTLGSYTYLIRSIGKIFTDNNISPFCFEMENLFENKFYNKLDFWAPERNEISHYMVNLTEEQIEVRCTEYLVRLRDLLIDVVFFISYPLLTVTAIQVIKPKHTKVHFSHDILFLNSASSEFQGISHDFFKYTDSQCVILIKSIKDLPDTFLNIYPLIIDTHSEKITTPEMASKLKKDVFLYSSWDEKEKRLYFVGTDMANKVDIRFVSFYEHLIGQFEEIMNIFSIKE